jgi:hypothetical protein
LKDPDKQSLPIPGTKTVHKIPYFHGTAELRNNAKRVLAVDCILKRDCNIFTRSGFDTVFQDGEVLGRLSCLQHSDLAPFVSSDVRPVDETIHLSNGGILLVRWLEAKGEVRCIPVL